MSGVRARLLLLPWLIPVLASIWAGHAATPRPQLPAFVQIETAPGGGTVWQGPIAFGGLPGYRRPTVVYLPPGASWNERYPVVVLLQGFRGSPYEFVDGVNLPSVADAEVADGRLPPFVAVLPPAGPDAQYRGEWAGVWERYLVSAVLPWARRRLPIIRNRSAWTLAGLSAGGYGALDIGLRHPRLFGTLESWSGYFGAPHDGPLAGAGPGALVRHDPTLLTRREAPLLRRLRTRFFLSSGTTHDRVATRASRTFESELARLGLLHSVRFAPGGHDGRFWRAQLPAALRYARAASCELSAR